MASINKASCGYSNDFPCPSMTCPGMTYPDMPYFQRNLGGK